MRPACLIVTALLLCAVALLEAFSLPAGALSLTALRAPLAAGASHRRRREGQRFVAPLRLSGGSEVEPHGGSEVKVEPRGEGPLAPPPPPDAAPKTPSEASSCGKKRIFSWIEARRYAHSFGFETREEYQEYGCPGAYSLPKKPDEVYAKEWVDWDDWLGTMLPFEEARERSRSQQIASNADWMELVSEAGDKNIEWFDDRVPIWPDTYRKYQDKWNGWDDWLGLKPKKASKANPPPSLGPPGP
mmetsp:Transcript_32965/g.77021  ORF Transcript_32965/g.77021 Transcript_32965/m.77021 type:complete len:244 (-) Transcript_32965:128-859(-)